MKKRVVFKPYIQNQASAFPPTFDEMIQTNHPVRVVNTVIEGLNLDSLLVNYKGGGTSSYHPKMLLKVLVYSYLVNIYSSRKMEAALQENIHFMWLSGMNTPDHNTLNRFRTDKLQGVLEQVFTQVVIMLHEQGLLNLKQTYTDGTKIEAHANRYTFVWGKSIKSSKERIERQLQELWSYAQSIAKEELSDTAPLVFEQIDPTVVEDTIAKIDTAIADKPVPPKVKQKINYVKKNFVDKLKKYEEQEQILKGRNSYSKTDPDATFMRMKDDHMRNSQLKPGYNCQISSSNQFIVNYSLHHQAVDYPTYIEHMHQYQKWYGLMPEVNTTDAGYGSEENLLFCKQEGITAFMKYNTFYTEQTKKHKQNSFLQANLHYDPETDILTCPVGKPMYNIGTRAKRTTSGFKQYITEYQAEGCASCPLKDNCFKAKSDRIVSMNHRLNNLKNEARNRLHSEEGIKHRRQRSIDVEPIFGNLKQNKKFKRFNLQGKSGTNIEFGLLAIAHNLKKMANINH